MTDIFKHIIVPFIAILVGIAILVLINSQIENNYEQNTFPYRSEQSVNNNTVVSAHQGGNS